MQIAIADIIKTENKMYREYLINEKILPPIFLERLDFSFGFAFDIDLNSIATKIVKVEK